MLCLIRKINEAVTIGDGIKVVVLRICGKRVHLGFQAPEGTRILRQEVVGVEPTERDVVELE